MSSPEKISPKVYRLSTNTKKLIPVVGATVSAAFPSPAIDFMEKPIDLNEYLIANETSTFVLIADGDCMSGAGIFDKNLLIVDRSVHPEHGMIAVCFLEGTNTLKRLNFKKGYIMLEPDNENFKPIKVLPEQDLLIWGIVRHTIKTFL